MQLETLAHTILFGDRLEDKLAFAPFVDTPRRPGLLATPRFPGRPPALSRVGKAAFPSLKELETEAGRGRLLHFFANHELLALELMALCLLKFPGAPPSFRKGIAGTLGEEQSHFRLYLERMHELGVDVGALPVSDYFWNAMRGVQSPLQFVTQMSLTLEQANLDYARFYRGRVEALGDARTAAILERVYREEIGHVRHGVTWFNRWRGDDGAESDWEAYLRLLPPPMTPRRAKGPEFSREARIEAGLSVVFVDRLEVHSGSKGRPPVVWHFNPLCEREIARGKVGLTPPEKARRLTRDLETLPAFLAGEDDIVLVSELPRPEWRRELRALGFRLPEFREIPPPRSLPRERNLAGVEPWGWSPEPFERFRPWRDRLLGIDGGNGAWARRLLEAETFAKTGLGELFSKAWSTSFLGEWLAHHPADEALFGSAASVGIVARDWPQARARLATGLQRGEALVAKAPWGTSGSGNRRFLDERELDGPPGGWLRNTLADHGAIVIEPWLDKVVDLSLQIEVTPETTRLHGVRPFFNGPQNEYRGTQLDPKLKTLPCDAIRFLHAGALTRWSELAVALGDRLRHAGYLGPAGLDALVWREPDGMLRLKPLVELNPRWTMGRVALAIEAHVARGAPAAWCLLPASTPAHELARRHPARLVPGGKGEPRLESGIVCTTDPERSREVVTLLVVGNPALDELRLARA